MAIHPSLSDLTRSIRTGNYHGYGCENFYVSLAKIPGQFGQTVYNAAFAHYDLPFVYVPLLCTDIGYDLKLIREHGFPGASITMPHKRDAMEFIDDYTDPAGRCHAINTVVNEKGRLIGHNTDLAAAAYALGGMTDDDCVIILGDGGMAHTFWSLLRGNPATAVSRANLENHRSNEATIVINATPRGMPGIASPYLFDHYPNCRLYIESVVNETAAQRMAMANGIEVVTGLEMAFQQAFKQFSLYTGKDAPEQVMRDAILVNE